MGIVNARAFGLVGSIMMLFDLYLGYLGVGRTGLLAVLGLVFVLIGVREVAIEANSSKIYRNYLIYFAFTLLFFLLLLFTTNPILLWVLLIIGAVFLRGSFQSLEVISGIAMFRYAYLIYFVGAVLFIVFVGLILLPIAISLQAIAFYTLPDSLEQIEEEYFEQPEEIPPEEESEQRSL
ncbi:MAG: DUF996 domain-containing protein [Archaeoglobaceae archaeon]